MPFDSFNLNEDVPGSIAAPDTATAYPWKHFIGGHMGRLGTRADMAVYQQYVNDIIDGVKKALATVDPTPYFAKYGNNVWAASQQYLAAVVASASGPVIKKYLGILAAADVYTASTTFAILESVRLDLGAGSQVHARPRGSRCSPCLPGSVPARHRRKNHPVSRIFITGSADGLGRAAAGALIRDGHDVVLHARSRERAAALSDLAPDAAGVVIGDLSSAAETRDLAGQVNQIGRMDAVIHNAGVFLEPSRAATADGHAKTLAVNTLAPYMLTALIGRPDRLIYLSSGLHHAAAGPSGTSTGPVGRGTPPGHTPKASCTPALGLAAGGDGAEQPERLVVVEDLPVDRLGGKHFGLLRSAVSSAPEASGHRGEPLLPGSGDSPASSRGRQARAGHHGPPDLPSLTN